eukprot:PLAT10499.1.p1 GENE.PLAT10499.1~~PLAT10499.1.p1  ORF type:complete len:850 (+),score=451.28 PLAT10499.1:343-2550(+)
MGEEEAWVDESLGLEMSSSVEDSSAAGSGAARRRVTAVIVPSPNLLFIGTEAGRVEQYAIDSGSIAYTYAGKGSGDEVEASADVKMAPVTKLAMSNLLGILAVAHSDGSVQLYYVDSGQWVCTLSIDGTVSQLLWLSSFGSLMAMVSGSNRSYLWDLEAGTTAILDCKGELDDLGKGSSTATCAFYDDARSIIFTGADDGTFFLRKVSRSADGAAFDVQLFKYGNPSASMPSTITTIWYDSLQDVLVTGDATGVVRLVEAVTGEKRTPHMDGAAVAAAAGDSADGSHAAAAATAAAAAAGGGGDASESKAEAVPAPLPPAASLPEALGGVEWTYGKLSVQKIGGQLGPLSFKLRNGDIVAPLASASWAGDRAASELPAMLQAQQGEWVCAPFGASRAVEHLTDDWAAVHVAKSHTPMHGIAAHKPWKKLDDSDKHIVMRHNFPPGNELTKLVRSVTVDADSPRVSMRLEVHARREVELPIGICSLLALPSDVGGALLQTAAFKFGMVFPGQFEPEDAHGRKLAAGARFDSLHAVPTEDGGTLDLSRLPLPGACEYMVQLCGITDGVFTLRAPGEDYQLRLKWDADTFPSLLLWISNRGRSSYPWDGKHVALGVQPVASAFDLGKGTSCADNPIAAEGIATSIKLERGARLVTSYSIEVSPCDSTEAEDEDSKEEEAVDDDGEEEEDDGEEEEEAGEEEEHDGEEEEEAGDDDDDDEAEDEADDGGDAAEAAAEEG